MAPRRATLAAAGLSVVTGAAVLLIATVVFSHHSINHDEGVYLFQAAMLLDGKLTWQLGDLAEAFRPWFFVAEDGRMYSKYAPVPAAMYAIGIALGEARLSLAAIATANVFLTFLIGRMLFDERVGLVAAGLFAASPLALVSTSVFLPYAATTCLNLVFAVCYLSGIKRGSRRLATAAGLAIGIAFFARPFTALLFALPFIADAMRRVWSGLREADVEPLVRQGLTAVGGTAWVLVTLAYNDYLTGDPLTFPYQAFAPLDGPGFGHRQMLGHAIDYTPAMGIHTSIEVLRILFGEWFVAGWLGTALAAAGFVVALGLWIQGDARPRMWPVMGLLVSVPAGNVLFWGNFNLLGSLSHPGTGMIRFLGPFYHFDLLLPLAVLAGLGLVALGDRSVAWFRAADRTSVVTGAVVVGLVVSGALAGAGAASAVGDPIERNLAFGDLRYPVYEPIDETAFEQDLVFVPRPYGNWLHHPFQYLRNDPAFDGPVVYALDRHVASDYEVLDAFPDRTPHRFTYRGTWPPDGEPVKPRLTELSRKTGTSLLANTTVGVPDHVDHAMVELQTLDKTAGRYTVEEPGSSVSVRWHLDAETASLAKGGQVDLDGHERLALLITLVQPGGATLTYRLDADVRTTGGAVEIIWPPERRVCPLVTDCGTEGTYLPDRPDSHRPDVWIESTLEGNERS